MKTPSAKRKTLTILAGILWSGVGLTMLTAAAYWILHGSYSWLLILGAVVLGFLKYKFMFSKVVRKNINRIYSFAPGKDKVCVFAFQNKKSYYLMLFMMLMGHFLRQFPLPPELKVFIYLTVGTALTLASLHYYLYLIGPRPLNPAVFREVR
ncbi:MAG: hypothetical protein ABIJ45_01610 [Candidatus Zixiibacteriota bacterium]